MRIGAIFVVSTAGPAAEPESWLFDEAWSSDAGALMVVERQNFPEPGPVATFDHSALVSAQAGAPHHRSRPHEGGHRRGGGPPRRGRPRNSQRR
jgi:hypothetical protein